ncbi:MAG: hypothetical protein ABI336_04700 [Humibacillus sp.]
MMNTKSGAVALVAALGISIVGASGAFAGESTGSGKTTPISQYRAASICSFSGQNPERFLDPKDPNYEPGHTQSWGQIPKAERAFLRTIGLSPGEACRGNAEPPTEP